ncbi:M23 family metallopeptidase [Paenibacillus wenxiniae]|uniref:M23 family metallopeptidase n=1 Tax=Paenibacillus wenxiniae TaxID=1636843 RepID=A0ABW4RE88_9BACL
MPADNSNVHADPSNPAFIQPEGIADALLQGKTKQIYAQLTPDFQQTLTEQMLADTVKQSLQGIQSFQPLSKPHTINGNWHYDWISDTGKLGLMAIVNKKEQIAAMLLQPIETFPATDNKTTSTTYQLPFQGDWFVFWGGHTVLQNYHYAVPAQRYAYDFVQLKDGMSYSGDPKLNQSYHAFGQPALAPADGTVINVVNNIADNEPVGKMNPAQPSGNMVIIQHGDEYSMLAHLEKGSVTVQKGDKVKRGQEIGKIGNSGNSSEAHLHFQVSDQPDLLEGQSMAIRWSDGLQPLKGDIVSNK